jgi:dihydroorotate dehydrogenase electron transfer subunit
MMRAVAGICADRGIPCQLALERHMACGVGTCQGCVVKVRDDQAPAGWRFALACKDGPVFPAEQLIWGHSAFSPSRTSADPAADQSEETPDR